MMVTITAIERGRPDPRSRVILHDDEVLAVTSKAVVEDLGLDVGDSCTVEELQDMIRAAEPGCARARALKAIERRDRSSTELCRRLIDEGFSQQAAREAVDALIEVGLVDDRRLAESIARTAQDVKGWGDRRIREYLWQRGLAHLADEIISGPLVQPEDERAYDAAQRLYRSSMTADRLAQRLVRRGFAWSTARAAAVSVLDSGSSRS